MSAETVQPNEHIPQIKQEKIDLEIEQRLKNSLQIKKEAEETNAVVDAVAPAATRENSSSSHSSTPDSQPADDKKCIEPIKTSNEILAELFGVFNAAPPDELLNDEKLLRKSRHKSKKHKKDKKLKRLKTEKSNEKPAADSNAKPNSSHKDTQQRPKHKKKKKHKEKAKDEERKKSVDSTNATTTTKIKIEVTKSNKNSNSNTKIKTEITKTTNKSSSAADSHHHHHHHHDHHEKSQNNKSKEDDEVSEISLSDEETYLQERALLHRRHSAKDSAHTTQQQQQKKHALNDFYASASNNHNNNSNNKSRSHERERERARRTTTRRSNSRNRSSRRSRSRSCRARSRRSRSRTHDLHIDKKKLLEVARKNAISMFKRGNLPNCANMPEEIKDKVLLNLRYGGRTVEDLTNFCRKISNGEHLSDLSSEEDSDIDKNGNPKAFHHPFQLKEREPIVLNLRQGKPLPVRQTTQDQTKAITMQFPVSSGQQHRMSEVWQPVEAKETLAALPALPTATQSTNMFKAKTLHKNVFQKPLPVQEQQEPAFRAIAANESTSVETAVQTTVAIVDLTTTATATTATPQPVPAAATAFVPEVAVPSTATDSVFPTTMQNFDVSSIISQRLEAMRRLQDNPNDANALYQMNYAQQEMSSWAASKHLPGQFTGSTGATILKTHQLNAGPQAWARRDQLTSTLPVNGGMGMRLLQKMGWKPGEGLGPQKQGSLQPLLLDVKLDKRGLKAREDYKPPVSLFMQQQQQRAVLKKSRPSQSIAQAQQNMEDKHPVCLLNELTSKRKWTPPLYEVIDDKGPAHSKLFKFSVSINGQTFVPPTSANTKKDAKAVAARYCLQQIGILSANNAVGNTSSNCTISI